MSNDISLVRYGNDQLASIRPTLVSLYAEVYEMEAAEDVFFSIDRFESRLRGHAGRPGWEAVVAFDGGEAAGYAYASPLKADTGWWGHMLQPLPVNDVVETGHRTLALFELMIRDPWRGTGLAKQIHEALLEGRPEERVTLLVEKTHPKVEALYESWGYHNIGDQQPFPDAPIYATMLRHLK
ncbi:GNAT family N-acetyltransferase [Kribbella qitaiheensis]|uniref:GNAT family N-acetyltransferase n=1 Tax=Kribbella qitaiheensis TaxID=1544730 RepID=A0A7G6WW39_9ACTN|nr:GNAT family N-acetyltransferase [Kribbella qitaiheensis]QNE18204.1 GNAT family N-acetyltransferase [Kribbella qitaiheensis]